MYIFFRVTLTIHAPFPFILTFVPLGTEHTRKNIHIENFALAIRIADGWCIQCCTVRLYGTFRVFCLFDAIVLVYSFSGVMCPRW